MSDKNLEAEALKLKEDGNALFKVKDYEKAIEKYSSAIVNLTIYRHSVPRSAFFTQTDPDASVSLETSKEYFLIHLELRRRIESCGVGRKEYKSLFSDGRNLSGDSSQFQR